MKAPLLEVRNLKKYFTTGRGLLHAVDDVSFSIEEGTTLGVVGESGCGKSTLGRTILHLYEPTDGKMFFEGRDITNLDKKELKEIRANMQMIFQDPYSSLDPRKMIEDTIMEPLKVYKIGTKEERLQKTMEIMRMVGLDERLRQSFPHELNGGRRQRVVVARALALNPKFIVCDEPVSALDVSVQAQILNLLRDLQKEHGLSYIFITHDMSVVRHISDEICVMYLGQIVEKCPTVELFKNPLHPYTQALLASIPVVGADDDGSETEIIQGELSSPINPKPGCRFFNRCKYACEKCREEQQFREVGPGHHVLCHMVK